MRSRCPKSHDGAVGADQLANDAVNTINIRDAAITGSKLDSNSVATANINNLAVTEPKLSADVAARLNPMGGAGGQSDPTAAFSSSACGNGRELRRLPAN